MHCGNGPFDGRTDGEENISVKGTSNRIVSVDGVWCLSERRDDVQNRTHGAEE
jgi:hypothetical protein